MAARRGLPVWIPLVALIVMFVFAVFVGSLICPVLSALVFPPEPPLPPGEVQVLEPQQSQGVGRDEWLFSTNQSACSVLRYYQDRIGGCNLDPEVPCSAGDEGVRPRDGASYPVGVCQGIQSIGALRLVWTIRIGGGYEPPHTTRFRITREVAN